MATLTIRGLDDGIIRRLQARAAENGRSAEAEHRAILEAALASPDTAPDRAETVARLQSMLDELQGRTFDIAEDLREVRSNRMRQLLGTDQAG